MTAQKNNQGFIIALVGMPGAGKSAATKHLNQKGLPFVRFGELTEEEVAKMNLPLTTENERVVREKLRKDLGMAAFAIKAEPKIDSLLKKGNIKHIILDGLYSWEEYIYLKERFPSLTLVSVYAEPEIRYNRLASRKIRPVSHKDSRNRDIAEIEKLNKGGPIAIADYSLENNSNDIEEFYQKVDELLKRLDDNSSSSTSVSIRISEVEK